MNTDFSLPRMGVVRMIALRAGRVAERIADRLRSWLDKE